MNKQSVAYKLIEKFNIRCSMLIDICFIVIKLHLINEKSKSNNIRSNINKYNITQKKTFVHLNIYKEKTNNIKGKSNGDLFWLVWRCS